MKLTRPVDERDHVRADGGARVTLLVYGDYQCPYTRALDLELARIGKARPGLVRYVYRHFPLRQLHPLAQKAAEAAEAAHAQGKFWRMHDRLFRGGHDPDRARIVEVARAIGLDVERLERELDEGVHAPRVEDDLRSGLESGVEGTPGVFLEGERWRGPRDHASLMAAFTALAGRR